MGKLISDMKIDHPEINVISDDQLKGPEKNSNTLSVNNIQVPDLMRSISRSSSGLSVQSIDDFNSGRNSMISISRPTTPTSNHPIKIKKS